MRRTGGRARPGWGKGEEEGGGYSYACHAAALNRFICGPLVGCGAWQQLAAAGVGAEAEASPKAGDRGVLLRAPLTHLTFGQSTRREGWDLEVQRTQASGGSMCERTKSAGS